MSGNRRTRSTRWYRCTSHSAPMLRVALRSRFFLSLSTLAPKRVERDLGMGARVDKGASVCPLPYTPLSCRGLP